MQIRSRTWLFGAVVIGGQFHAGPARGVEIERALGADAVVMCQPALPAFEGLIRKRPLAVQNEGTAAAFVTCGFVNDTYSTGTRSIYVGLINNASVAQNIQCTLVDGFIGAAIQYLTKTMTIDANSRGSIGWSKFNDNGGNFFSPWISVSCVLQPGTGIGILQSTYFEDVAN